MNNKPIVILCIAACCMFVVYKFSNRVIFRFTSRPRLLDPGTRVKRDHVTDKYQEAALNRSDRFSSSTVIEVSTRYADGLRFLRSATPDSVPVTLDTSSDTTSEETSVDSSRTNTSSEQTIDDATSTNGIEQFTTNPSTESTEQSASTDGQIFSDLTEAEEEEKEDPTTGYTKQSTATAGQIYSKIKGAKMAMMGDRPYHVSVEVKVGPNSYRHACSGVLFHSRLVITTASCLRSEITSRIFVFAGTTKLRSVSYKYIDKIQAVEVHPHPEFEQIAHKYNVAIIRLAKAFSVDERVSKIDVGSLPEDLILSKTCTVSGWGPKDLNRNIQPDSLYVAEVILKNKLYCKMALRAEFKVQTELCTVGAPPKNLGFCQSDEGSPLVCDGILVGITTVMRRGICRYRGLNKYTDLSDTVDWMRNILRNSGAMENCGAQLVGKSRPKLWHSSKTILNAILIFLIF